MTGNTPNKNIPSLYGDSFPFFKPTDLTQGMNVSKASEYLSEEGKRYCRIVPKGATVVCCIGSIGKSGLLSINGATNQQLNAIIPIIISNKYMYFYSCTNLFVTQLINSASATTISIVNKNKMSNVLLPIPPIKEQIKIVSQIEKNMKLIQPIEELL